MGRLVCTTVLPLPGALSLAGLCLPSGVSRKGSYLCKIGKEIPPAVQRVLLFSVYSPTAGCMYAYNFQSLMTFGLEEKFI